MNVDEGVLCESPIARFALEVKNSSLIVKARIFVQTFPWCICVPTSLCEKALLGWKTGVNLEGWVNLALVVLTKPMPPSFTTPSRFLYNTFHSNSATKGGLHHSVTSKSVRIPFLVTT